MWFIFALLTMLAWGSADLFYKKGAGEEVKYSHLNTSIMVGFVMGIHAFYMLIFGDIDYDISNIIIYLPVSAMYIISMTIGYFGLRYLEVSISSPVQNTSGALVSLMCFLFLGQSIGLGTAAGIILVSLGIFLLGLFERQEMSLNEGDKKYSIGFVAFMMPVLYCIFDALGTYFDAYYLDDIASTPLVNVTEETFEDVANVSYELTFFMVAVLLLIYITVIKKEKFHIKKQGNNLAAAVFETIGQSFYVYAMSGNGIVAAPMVAAYSIVSVILSRLILKEKLKGRQYAAVAVVMAGIILLGLMEALAE